MSLSPAPDWAAFMKAFDKSFPEFATGYDYGGNIYVSKGPIPPGTTIVVTPNGDFIPEGVLIGLYKDDPNPEDGDEPLVTPGVVFGRDVHKYPDRFLPKIRLAIYDMLAALNARLTMKGIHERIDKVREDLIPK